MTDARRRSTPGPPRIVGDRDQLAARLLTELIQPLFGLGLHLQAIIGLTQEAEVRRRLDAAIDDLDTVIHDLRADLFDLTVGEVRPPVPEGPPEDDPRPAQRTRQRLKTTKGAGRAAP